LYVSSRKSSDSMGSPAFSACLTLLLPAFTSSAVVMRCVVFLLTDEVQLPPSSSTILASSACFLFVPASAITMPSRGFFTTGSSCCSVGAAFTISAFTNTRLRALYLYAAR